MNDMTLFLDLILIASGAYCMYTFLRLAVTKRLFKNGLLVPKEKKISDCADEAAAVARVADIAAKAKERDALAKEMGMQINLTRQEVFDAMHTI